MRTLMVARRVHNNPLQTQLKGLLDKSLRDPIKWANSTSNDKEGHGDFIQGIGL